MPCPCKPTPSFHSEDWMTEWDCRSVIAHQLPGHHEHILFLYTISMYQYRVQNKVLHHSPLALLIQRELLSDSPHHFKLKAASVSWDFFLTLSLKKYLFLCMYVIYTFFQ